MKPLRQLYAAIVLTAVMTLPVSAGDIGNPSAALPPAQTTGDMHAGVTSGGYLPNGVISEGEIPQPLTAIGEISCGGLAITLAHLWSAVKQDDSQKGNLDEAVTSTLRSFYPGLRSDSLHLCRKYTECEQ
jgi:hypothetical protein